MSVYRTLESWNSRGRYITRGEKSKLRCPDTKLPLFEKSQTTKMKNVERCWHNDFDRCNVNHYEDWSDWDTVIGMEY
jgi:hypothetical protein